MAKQREPKWWQYVIAYTILRPLGFIVGLVLFLIMEVLTQTVAIGIARIFKQEPNRWFIPEEVYELSSMPDSFVDTVVIYLDLTGYLEHQLSERIMTELQISDLRRSEAYEREGEQFSFNGHLYEYRLMRYPGIGSRVKNLLARMTARPQLKTA